MTVSSTLDSDHSVDQIYLGTLPTGTKVGYWQSGTNDTNPSIQVILKYKLATLQNWYMLRVCEVWLFSQMPHW